MTQPSSRQKATEGAIYFSQRRAQRLALALALALAGGGDTEYEVDGESEDALFPRLLLSKELT